MYQTSGLGKGGGGHGGGGGGHHGGGGGGGHHGGGGGFHHGGRGGGTTIIQGGGPGWWGGDASWPYGYPVYIEEECEVRDQNGRCAIFDANGRIIGFKGLGEDAPAPAEADTANLGHASTWVTGGILVALAVAVFALDAKMKAA